MTSIRQRAPVTIDSATLTNSECKSKNSSSLLWKLLVAVHTTCLPIFIIIFMPNLTLILWYTIRSCNGSLAEFFNRVSERSLLGILQELWKPVLSDNMGLAALVMGLYIVWSLVLMKCLPGPKYYGPLTPKGNLPTYTDNGFYCYLTTMIALALLTLCMKMYGSSPSVIYDIYGEILVCFNLFSLIFCLFLYVKGIYFPSTTDSGATGNFIFDYYWGTELYPRVFGIDIKSFTNCRFGMTLWGIFVVIFAIKSYELHGFVDSMFVSAVLHIVYVTKFFWWEAGYMQTMDIVVDRAGFYICWGCFSLVPSLYVNTPMYLVNHPYQLGLTRATLILVCGLISVSINYMADWQKQIVRKTAGNCQIWGGPPKIIRAQHTLANGKRKESILLASGWWGVSRHFHYIPEVMVAFFWSAPGGVEGNVAPFFYFIFLTILLMHRSFRDELKCSKKYGGSWDEYCRIVPYRIVPYIF